MKKRVLLALAAAIMLLSFTACGGNAGNDMENDMNNLEEGLENDGQILEEDMQQGMEQGMQNAENAMDSMMGGEPVTRYSENDIEFDVPESWRNNFKATLNQHNENTNQGYSTIDFYYSTNANSPYKIMTIGRFPKAVWETVSKNTPEAEGKKLGQSKDGEWIYSLNFEAEPLSQDKGYLAAKSDAEKLKDKIKITK